MYFSDRLYSNEELPKDFKMNISEENQPASGRTTTSEVAETSSLVPAGSEHQGHRTGLSEPETGSPTPGQKTELEDSESPEPLRAYVPPSCEDAEHGGGFHTILDSVEEEPLRLWQKEVSV